MLLPLSETFHLKDEALIVRQEYLNLIRVKQFYNFDKHFLLLDSVDVVFIAFLLFVLDSPFTLLVCKYLTYVDCLKKLEVLPDVRLR